MLTVAYQFLVSMFSFQRIQLLRDENNYLFDLWIKKISKVLSENAKISHNTITNALWKQRIKKRTARNSFCHSQSLPLGG
jgi:hypothetical protein